MRHEVVGDLFRARAIQPTSDVDCHQFFVFPNIICFLLWQ
jgi:hypothetical protein